MFSRLRNRYWLTGKLVFDGAVHVGSGIAEGDVDMPVVRDRSGKAFIPGSSLRGAMRSLVERTVATLDEQRSCLLFDSGPPHGYCPTVNEAAKKRIQELIENGETARAVAILLGSEAQPGRLCDTCRLFGSPHAASKLKIFDLTVSKGEGRNIRHGVGIDRDEGKAREKIKFEYEVVERSGEQTQFEFEMVGENLGRVNGAGGSPESDPDLALLGLAWKQMGAGLTVGAKSGSGLGRCRIALERVRYFDELRGHGLRAFLTAKEGDGYGQMTPQQFSELLEAEVRAYLGVEARNA